MLCSGGFIDISNLIHFVPTEIRHCFVCRPCTKLNLGVPNVAEFCVRGVGSRYLALGNEVLVDLEGIVGDVELQGPKG